MCQFGPSTFDDTDWRRAAGGLVEKFEKACPFLLQCAAKLLTFAKILASDPESRERHLAVDFCVADDNRCAAVPNSAVESQPTTNLTGQAPPVIGSMIAMANLVNLPSH